MPRTFVVQSESFRLLRYSVHRRASLPEAEAIIGVRRRSSPTANPRRPAGRLGKEGLVATSEGQFEQTLEMHCVITIYEVCPI